MTYLRSLFLNFLIVFFVNRVIPGMEIKTFEQVPNIGADILFAIIVGFLNASIFPALVLFNLKPTDVKMAVVAFIISFGGFILIYFIHFGVKANTFGAAVISGLIVWIISFFTNHLELKHYQPK